MATKKKRTSRASRASRRAALAKFQSPVHSNGFKQDVLIDLHGGDVGLDTAANADAAANLANAAGKTYFRYGGTTYKVVPAGRGVGAGADDRNSVR